jgi:sugar phosphate isomerase/epimerase
MWLSYSNLACPEWQFEKTLEAVRTYGFEGLEVRLFDGEVVTPSMPVQARRRGEAAIRATGVPIVALDSSLQAAGPDHQAFLEDLEVMAEIAEQWRAPLLRVFGGPLPEAAPERYEAMRRTAAVLAEGADVTRQHGVALALETHDDFASSHRVAEVLAMTGGGVLAVYDTLHPHRLGESPEEVLGQLGMYIALVQVKDAVRGPGDEWRLVPMGEGEVPVAEVLGRLPAAGYNGWVSLEFEKKWHPELPPPETALKPQADLLRHWLGEGA